MQQGNSFRPHSIPSFLRWYDFWRCGAMQNAEATTAKEAGHAETARHRPPRSLLKMLRRGPRKRMLSLALQGGGSFGAFTWGVLDRLLEQDGVALDTISGTSAGAVNAVVLANGLAEGGPAAARDRLARFWRRVSNAAGFSGAARVAATSALELSTRVFSPYQFNPLDHNPLRDMLAEEIDFARLRRSSPVRLLIAATRLRDGRPRLFREHEITLEAVLASASLPLLHHAVGIEGEWYWDGGYSANPPLRQLVIDSKAADIMVVQISPQEQDGVPRLPSQIARLVAQVTFNGPLRRDIEALDDLCALCREERIFRSRLCRKLNRLRLHHIVAEHTVAGLHRASAFNVDWNFLTALKQAGREATENWLVAG
jgi:NTE family protein